jgi:predicted NAD/FAD-dependent oxidoreductase
MKIAIIGTGMAASALTYRLRNARPDIQLQLFEKSRGVGGRMSTRRREPWAFDHGVPFFTARTQSFQQMLKAFQSEGVVAEWQPRVITLSKGKKPYTRDWFEPHYVATPNMNHLCKALLGEQPIQFQQTINGVKGEPGRWHIVSTEGREFGPFEYVVCTAPAEQTQVILQNVTASPGVDFEPCFTLMLSCAADYQPTFDAARVNNGNLKWLSWSNSKPGRTSQASLVAHGTGDYSLKRFDDDREVVQAEMLAELTALVADLPIESVDLHRWKYAQVVKPLGNPFWTDESESLFACGDWCLGNEVEDAFGSADLLADKLVEL